jgi:hypothetical protein
VVPAGSPLATAWDVFRAAPGAELLNYPLLFAVACAVAGIEAYLWRHGLGSGVRRKGGRDDGEWRRPGWIDPDGGR